MKTAPGGIGFAPDIEDRDMRDHWVKDTARKIFTKHGSMLRTLILRTPPKIAILTMDLPLEMAEYGGEIARKVAADLHAQQLYLAVEMWYSEVRGEEEIQRVLREGPRVEARNDPKRKEALMITSEDPFCNPPLRSWTAEITRDAQGKPSLGPWAGNLQIMEGRLVYLLPPEAYLAAGKNMPTT